MVAYYLKGITLRGVEDVFERNLLWCSGEPIATSGASLTLNNTAFAKSL